MFKNISRKGIAFGAVAALTSSVFAALPASADSLSNSYASVSYSGSGLTVVEGSDFEVTVTPNSQYAYWTTTNSGSFFTAVPYSYVQYTYFTGAGYVESVDYEYAPSASVPAVDSWSNNGEDPDDPAGVYITGKTNVSAATSIKWEKSSNDATVSGSTSATFTHIAVNADKAVTFTPYISNDEDATRDLDEPQGPAITVTFANNTQQLTTTLTKEHTDVDLDGDSFYLDDFILTAKVTGPSGYNMAQMYDDVRVNLYRANTFIDFSDYDGSDDYLDLSGDNYLYTSEGHNLYWTSEDLATGYYTARAFLNNNTVALSPMSGQAIAGQISTIANLDDIYIIEEVSANRTDNGYLRAGTKSVSVSAQLTDADGNDLKVAGVDVVVEVYADDENDIDSVISLNGTAVSRNSTKEVTVKTDANGVATVTVTSNTGADDDVFEIYFTVVDRNGDYETASEYFEWEDAYIDNMWESHSFSTDEVEDATVDADAVIGSIKGQNVTLTYHVYDQFGQPFTPVAGEDYRLEILTNEGETLLGSPAIKNGKAVLSYEETLNAGDSYEVVADIEYKNEATDWLFTDAGYNYYYSYVVVGTTSTVGAVTAELMTAAADLEISTGLFVNLNKNLVENENLLAADQEGFDGTQNDITIQGRVLDANNVPIAGAPVTITLPKGGQIDAETPDWGWTGSDIFSTSTLTVYTTDSGWYAVDINTHYSGDNVVNVTAGGKSASVTISVANPTEFNETDVLSVVAPASVKAGSTSPVQVKLVDKWGNPLAAATAAVSAAGLGSLSAASVSIVNGVGYVTMLNGSADRGTTTINAVVTSTVADGDDLDSDPDPAYDPAKTATATVFTGPTATITKGAKAGTIIVTVFGAAGDDIRTVVNGKRVDVRPAKNDSFKFTLKGIDSGKQRVKVTADYVLLKSKVVPVK